ncbi:MAG: head GIN domain-containing protein [Bacteroidota bacterium]
MKNTLLFTAFVLLIGTSLTAQNWRGRTVEGQGPKVQKELQLKSFDGLELMIGADVVLSQGQHKVVVDAQQNIIDAMKVEVHGGTLEIGTKKNLRSHKPITIYVTTPDLTEVVLSGSGNIDGKDRFKGLNDIKIVVSGSGNIDLDFDAKRVESRISGSGNITMAGKTSTMEVEITGSGNYRAKELKAGDCEVSITGSGKASVHADNSLEATITGSGDVYYTGSPKVRSKILGSGDVRSRG